MTKKILLINPPESGRGEYSTPPLGILYIAGMLKANGIDVDIIDGYIAGWAGIEEKIKSYRPAIVGITCHTYSRVKALKVAELVKRIDPGIMVEVGGAHATLMHRQLIENYPSIDIVMRGEGEITFLELCQGKDLASIDGITYRTPDRRIVENPDRKLIANLDDIPFPAWELIDIKKYPSDGTGIYNGIDIAKEPCVPVVFSRGCIGTCVFCADKLLWKRWRGRSAKNMADELDTLVNKYGAKRFCFNDDLFTANRRATMELCDEIVKRGLKIAFEIVSRTDCIYPELLQALKKAGCFKINFGIETASEELLKVMKKPISIKVSEEAIKMTKAAGIKTSALIIAGNLGETRETINETIDFLKRAQPDDVGLANGLRILPGTELYEHAKKVGFIADDFWLSDYNWKIFTYENSKLDLNIFHEALNRRQRLPAIHVLDVIRYRRFYWKTVEDAVKASLIKLGLLKKKKKQHKYEVAY
jgi:anaerobic magnesium-protoporphyrin IX monomethyl ester cyclase